MTGNTVGHIAVFECDPGYELIGDDVLGCQEDGQWSGNVPRCRQIGMACITMITDIVAVLIMMCDCYFQVVNYW